MQLDNISLAPYSLPMSNGRERCGVLVGLCDNNGNWGWGDIAPLPNFSQETLPEALAQVERKKEQLFSLEWTVQNCLKQLLQLHLYPAVTFGIESALLTLLAPMPSFSVPVSCLLMGTPEEILQQAEKRSLEGYISAKLKVSNLSFDDAALLINILKEKFSLRIDVNRAWSKTDALRFFEQFPLNTFDYVEEPMQNSEDLVHFPHPLAVDESFPDDLSLLQLETLPTLKALIYKPTLQGGLLGVLSWHQWAHARGIKLVLSSSFESDLGLAHVASIAYRLDQHTAPPVGLGTYHHVEGRLCEPPLEFALPMMTVPSQPSPRKQISCRQLF